MFEYLFSNYFIFYVTDYGTTWRDPNLAATCTQNGISAVPGDAVPGCVIPGYLSPAFA